MSVAKEVSNSRKSANMALQKTFFFKTYSPSKDLDFNVINTHLIMPTLTEQNLADAKKATEKNMADECTREISF